MDRKHKRVFGAPGEREGRLAIELPGLNCQLGAAFFLLHTALDNNDAVSANHDVSQK